MLWLDHPQSWQKSLQLFSCRYHRWCSSPGHLSEDCCTFQTLPLRLLCWLACQEAHRPDSVKLSLSGKGSLWSMDMTRQSVELRSEVHRTQSAQQSKKPNITKDTSKEIWICTSFAIFEKLAFVWTTLCEAIDRFRSIATWVHSTLFLVVMVTAASPLFAWIQPRNKRCCWCFEKTFILQKKLSFWPSEVALPFIPAPCSGVVRTSCLGVWFAELEVNGLPTLNSSCDLDDSVVWTSISRSERNSALLGNLGSLSVTWRIWDDFWQTFQCATNLWIGFSWSVRQKLSDKVRL